MWQQMLGFFKSAFYFAGLEWVLIPVSIGLSLVFGALWLALYRPPLFRRPALWAVAAVSALLTWAAIAFIQIPLQTWAGQALLYFWDQATLIRWLLLAGIPQILLSGLVQEAAKLVPVFFYLRRSIEVTPKLGLLVGTVSGAGFGIFEAIWVHNTIFASGWTLDTVQTAGFSALLGFVERFFAIGFHIAAAALAGYGLARHKGWRFYLLAAFLHGLTNYAVVLMQKGILSSRAVEVYVGIIAVSVTVLAVWLLNRNKEEPALEQA